MMLRFRRYRVFLFVALLVTITLYHLSHTRDWDAAANLSVERLRNWNTPGKEQSPVPAGGDKASTEKNGDNQESVGKGKAVSEAAIGTSASAAGTTEGTSKVALASTSTSSTTSTSTLQDVPEQTTSSLSTDAGKKYETEDPDTEPAIPANKINGKFGQHGQGRLEVEKLPNEELQPHWRKQPEHFPVPSASIIPLPTGKSKNIPKIQHKFKDESVTEKTDRERKQAAIKEAFAHAWTGYRDYAIPHDELRPISGDFKDPFNGWGATLVDTLDTLWIMDMKAEFNSAVDYVKKIDFTTSPRKDIPVFETTIRYLGGLLAAYDISNQQYRILLDKAIELAEVLMGAFDTPNRMPITFYHWAPSYSSQPHRSGTRVVMAELGSLSVEFTRLAQLTRENKYYDAIARITDEFEKYQNATRLPGLWRVHVDASGSRKPAKRLDVLDASLADNQDNLSPHDTGPVEALPHADRPKSNDGGPPKKEDTMRGVPPASPVQVKPPSAKPAAPLEKRQLDDAGISTADNDESMLQKDSEKSTLQTDSVKTTTKPGSPRSDDDLQVPKPDYSKAVKTHDSSTIQKPIQEVDCEEQGLASPPHSRSDTYSLGAMTDSTFEYLPKEYMLLGGQVDQYKKMYEYAMDTAREELLYKPMVKDGSDLLFSGKKMVYDDSLDPPQKPEMEYEVTHLTCFAGGMFAVGAKVFEIEGDLDIARKLTDGCVWAYTMMQSGIMPEVAMVVPCESKEGPCEWNETKWYDLLDPNSERRIQQVKDWNEQQKTLAEKLAAAEALAEQEKEQAAAAEAARQESSAGVAGRDSASDGSADTEKDASTASTETESTPPRKDTTSDTTYNLESSGLKKRAAVPAEGAANAPQPMKQKIKVESDYEPDEGSAPVAAPAAPAVKPGLVKGKITKVDEDAAGKIPSEKLDSDSATSNTNTQPTKTKIQKENIEAAVPVPAEAESPSPAEVTKVMKSIFTPNPIISHEEFAKKKITEQRLADGFVHYESKKYILRPEAIESVFIMYRVTGDETWREKGWKMFTAIQEATRTEHANSAIHDVTSDVPEPDDTMESFWLAETLKYFYLLFSEPSVVDLDEWVLNTEAHPFKRPTK